MRINNPADWIIERLKADRPFFAIRFNDGEHTCMYRTQPEGKVLGTDANPAPCNYQLGDELRDMLREMAVHHYQQNAKLWPNCKGSNLLIGCSWGTDRADSLCVPFGDEVNQQGLADANWCNEHWPLDGVVDGSTVRMLDVLRKHRRVVLVTCKGLEDASWCLGRWSIPSGHVEVPSSDSWSARNAVYKMCVPFAIGGYTFVWAAGIGLKPTAWRLFKEFPQSSHVDVGHLFNGAFGLRDYGWLMRQDGPWWEPYFREGGFKDWVLSFVRRTEEGQRG